MFPELKRFYNEDSGFAQYRERFEKIVNDEAFGSYIRYVYEQLEKEGIRQAGIAEGERRAEKRDEKKGEIRGEKIGREKTMIEVAHSLFAEGESLEKISRITKIPMPELKKELQIPDEPSS